MKKLLAFAAMTLGLLLAAAPSARAQVAVDDTILLDPFDPVPEIQFRHFGDNGCWDACGYYDRCHSGCERRHCYRDCYGNRRCDHGCRNWHRCDHDCWHGIGCERDCWDDGEGRHGAGREEEQFHRDHEHFKHDEERFREDTDVYEGLTEDYENRYIDQHHHRHHHHDAHDWHDEDANYGDGGHSGNGDYYGGPPPGADGHHDGHDGPHDGEHHDGEHHDGDHHDDGYPHDGPH